MLRTGLEGSKSISANSELYSGSTKLACRKSKRSSPFCCWIAAVSWTEDASNTTNKLYISFSPIFGKNAWLWPSPLGVGILATVFCQM